MVESAMFKMILNRFAGSKYLSVDFLITVHMVIIIEINLLLKIFKHQLRQTTPEGSPCDRGPSLPLLQEGTYIIKGEKSDRKMKIICHKNTYATGSHEMKHVTDLNPYLPETRLVNTSSINCFPVFWE